MFKMENLRKMNAFNLYTIEDISKEIGIEINTIRYWIRRGLRVHATIGGKSHILGKDIAYYWETFIKNKTKRKRKPIETKNKIRKMAIDLLNSGELLPKRPHKKIADKFDITPQEVEYITRDLYPPRAKIRFKDYINTYSFPKELKKILWKMRLKDPDIVRHLGVWFYSKEIIGLLKSQMQNHHHKK